MKSNFYRAALCAAIFTFIGVGKFNKAAAQKGSNDHMFPAADAAKPFIDFDSKGFIINGKRTFIVSAGLEYARIPHELWYDRLLRLKRAGFNCVEVYTFWNFHEPKPGKFEFSGDHDLDAFLKLVHKMGMYAIPRVGPYYCAEWDNGGYPVWLRFIPNLKVRVDDLVFEKYVDRFFDTLMPIVSKNQVNKGGSVILVQLENEHPDGWGTYMPNGYFTHLRQKALQRGLQVPYFFSGVHHSSDPAGNSKLLDDANRPNPWFSTEFWSVWYDYYSSTEKDAQTYERRTMKIIAHGGNGYNYYMAHGGTNFGYTNDDEDAASYDYGAAVGQAGNLRPIYYAFKRCAWFARSFQDVLENSNDATSTYANMFEAGAVQLTARHSKAGDIIFLDNPGKTTQQAQLTNGDTKLPQQGSLTLAPGDILPVVHNFAVTPNVNLKWAPVKILRIQPQGNTTTIVIYGEAGTPAELYFTTTGKTVITKGNEGLSASNNNVALKTTFSDENKAGEFVFSTVAGAIRILTVNAILANRTWFVNGVGVRRKSFILTGPAYLNDIETNGNTFTAGIEKNWKDSLSIPAIVYGDNFTMHEGIHNFLATQRITQLPLTPWQAKNASAPVAVNYDDSKWLKSVNPAQMGQDGDTTADAWYRANINIDSAGLYTLRVGGGDRAIVFIDGKAAGSGVIRKGEIALTLEEGKHVITVFTAHDGRYKFFSFKGNMDSIEAKGLFGNVQLRKGGESVNSIGGWKFLKAASKDDVSKGIPSSTADGWVNYTIGKDAFNARRGFGWFQTTLPVPVPGTKQLLLNFKSVDENATVFINGRHAEHHDGWNMPFEITLNNADTITQPLVLSVFIENYDNTGGIDQPVFCDNVTSFIPITGWRMKGGIGDFSTIGTWQPLTANTPAGMPYYFRAQFTAPAYAQQGHHPIWRVISKGLGHGSVWVNGHNLGRYPEKIPINGLYIPECWLKAGVNEVVIYDEDGKSPGGVTIEAEDAASWDSRTVLFEKNK